MFHFWDKGSCYNKRISPGLTIDRPFCYIFRDNNYDKVYDFHGRFLFVKSFSPSEHKAAKPAFDPLGQLVYLLLRLANKSNNGVIGVPPEAASGAILYQKAVLAALKHLQILNFQSCR